MTLSLLAITKLKAIRDHLQTAGYPTHMIIEEIDNAIDEIHEFQEKVEAKSKPIEKA